MAAFDIPVQLERDLRSAHKDFKRHKDSTAKWAYGDRPLPGRYYECLAGQSRSRPQPKNSNATVPHYKTQQNVVRRTAPRYGTRYVSESAGNRVCTSIRARDEIQEISLGLDLDAGLLPQGRHLLFPTGDALLSFDHVDSPPAALTLDLFVKPSVRATEKLVAKEYEILDANGDALTGRKARHVLRQASAAVPSVATPVDDDGFELV